MKNAHQLVMDRYRDFLGNQRTGQALMNALRSVDAETYVKITGTDLDPFYDDSKVPAFIEKLKTLDAAENDSKS